MINMKKIAFVLVVCMLLSCAGCSEPTLWDQGHYSQRLDAAELSKTAAPVVLGDAPNDLLVRGMKNTVGMPLVMEMAARERNPIALFLTMVQEGVYEKNEQRDGFHVACTYIDEEDAKQVFRVIPDTEPMSFREEAAFEELFCQALRMSSMTEDNVSLESALLNRVENSADEIVQHSPEDQCWYSYFVCYDSECAYILVMYYHDSAVELQSLWLSYKEGGYAGCGTSQLYSRNAWSAQTASLICAMEKLITGESMIDRSYAGCDEFAVYELPGSYELGTWQVEIGSQSYSSDLPANEFYMESAELVNYRISR